MTASEHSGARTTGPSQRTLLHAGDRSSFALRASNRLTLTLNPEDYLRVPAEDLLELVVSLLADPMMVMEV